MRVLPSQASPPSASPDSTLAHRSVNYPAVSARYRRAFCVMHGLRPLYKQIYSLYSEAHMARVGFGESEILKVKGVHTLPRVSDNTAISRLSS